MLAHHQCGLLNAAAFARALGVDAKTVASYLDLLVDLLLVRRLRPWHGNPGKRLIKSPKVYIRDSGLVHALLGLRDLDAVLGHPVVGASWEGFVIETLIGAAPADPVPSFYRTSAGAEIDLLLDLPNRQTWAIEVKRSLSPKVEKGFHAACEELKPDRKFLVYPGTESFPLAHGVEVIEPGSLAQELARVGQGRKRDPGANRSRAPRRIRRGCATVSCWTRGRTISPTRTSPALWRSGHTSRHYVRPSVK